MNKSSRKQTNVQELYKGMGSGELASIKYTSSVQPVTKQWISRAKVNKFKGMADNIEEIEPEIIPGYKIRG